ncbi:MAG: hypothetical protein ACREQ7_11030 [Candidatus Binatia bacterium]
MNFRNAILFLPALLLIGCGVTLAPAPGANTLPGNKAAAVAEAGGVRMVVMPNRWSGSPADLKDVVTPLRVTIENGSGQPLRIRYNEFALVGPAGFTASALPPYKVEGTVVEPVFLPQTYYDGFYVARHYEAYFPGAKAWRHPWDFDEFYYTSRYNLWVRPLPTQDMLERAIVEGVLEPEGHIWGFLYFEKADRRLKRIAFTADLINARTGAKFGAIRIPFTFK